MQVRVRINATSLGDVGGVVADVKNRVGAGARWGERRMKNQKGEDARELTGRTLTALSQGLSVALTGGGARLLHYPRCMELQERAQRPLLRGV